MPTQTTIRRVTLALLAIACAFAVFAFAATARATDVTRKLTYGGIARYYVAHIPDDRSPPRAGWSIVLVFHGGGSAPEFVRYESGFDSVADASKFVTVYPAGTVEGKPGTANLTWNDGRPYKDGRPNTVDDVGFTLSVLADLSKILPVDATRTFAAGYSNGAQFVYRLAKQQPGRIAAIGTVAGQRGPNDLIKADGPLSVIQFSGMLDTIAPYNGGSPSVATDLVTILQAAPTVAQQWATFDRCASRPVTRTVGQAVSQTWLLGTGGAEVQFWTLKDGGHTWPGGQEEPSLAGALGPVNQDVFAAQLMWQFFSRHPLKGAK